MDCKKAVKEIIEAPATDLSKVNPNDQIGFGKWLNGQMKEKFSNFDFSKLSKDDQKELVKHVSNLISNRLLASLAKAEPPAATERPPATTAQAPAEKPKRELSERELDNLLDELEAPDALKKLFQNRAVHHELQKMLNLPDARALPKRRVSPK